MSIKRNRPPTLSGGGRQIRPRSPAEALEPTRAPARPKGSRTRREARPVTGFVRFVSGVFTAALMAMFVIGGSSLLLNHQYNAAGPLTSARAITIRNGEGRLEIAKKLEVAGIIQSRQLFVINYFSRNFVRWFGGEPWRDLKAGEYEFKPGASMRLVLEGVATGRTVAYSITVPEGLTSQQIVQRVLASSQLVGDVALVPNEGSLLPDTYSFSKGSGRDDVIKRMQADQRRVLGELWEKRASDLPIATMDEALILASIVEKETGQRSERKRVAAVFVNRMRKGMKLQSDPTIIYGLAGGTGTLGRPIYRSDIKKKTPYNTYIIKGLPPTPICNPGRAAIEAVLAPAQTDELFFVADGSGGHQFSRTLKEHNAAVANWREIEKAARARAKAEAAAREKAGVVANADGTSVETPQQGGLPVAPGASGDGSGGPAIGVVSTLTASASGERAGESAGGGDSVTPGEPTAGRSSDIPLPVRKPR